MSSACLFLHNKQFVLHGTPYLTCPHAFRVVMTCLYPQQKTWPHPRMRPGSKAVSSDLSVTYNPTAQTLLPHERQEEVLANRGKRCSRGCGCDRRRRCRCDRVTEGQFNIC